MTKSIEYFQIILENPVKYILYFFNTIKLTHLSEPFNKTFGPYYKL
jgi:hypothetical protein